jgi:hypothetical protein
MWIFHLPVDRKDIYLIKIWASISLAVHNLQFWAD